MTFDEFADLKDVVKIRRYGRNIKAVMTDSSEKSIGFCHPDRSKSTGLFAETGHNAISLASGRGIPVEDMP